MLLLWNQLRATAAYYKGMVSILEREATPVADWQLLASALLW
jgi:hypothetical protein